MFPCIVPRSFPAKLLTRHHGLPIILPTHRSLPLTTANPIAVAAVVLCAVAEEGVPHEAFLAHSVRRTSPSGIPPCEHSLRRETSTAHTCLTHPRWEGHLLVHLFLSLPRQHTNEEVASPRSVSGRS
jgi:hypothetical protein